MRKRFKQLLTVILVLINLILMGAVPYADAEENADYNIGLLKKLGFVDDTYGPKSGEDYVTRGQFACMLAKLRGLESIESTGKSFIDIPKDYWCAGEIYALCNLDILHGTSEDRFSPNDNITYPQMVKCLVSILGYDMQAQAAGGYPNGYLSAASQIGLKSAAGSGEVKFADAAKLMTEAMDVELLELKISAGERTYEKTPNQTLLKKYHDIYYDTGIMTDNGITALSSASKTGKNNVIINGIILDKGEFDADEFIGFNLKYYYRNRNGEKTLLYAYPYKNDIKTLTDSDIDREEPNFSVSKIYSTDNRKYYKVDEYADVIYNGMAYPSYNADTFRVRQGELTLVDNDKDGDFDVVIVKEYYNIYVYGTDAVNDIIYGKYGNSVNTGSCDNMVFYTADGALSALEEISSGNIISVYQSKDLSNIKFIISSKVVSGKVEGIENGVTKPSDMTLAEAELFKDSMRDMKIRVGETMYSFSDSYIEAVSSGYSGAVVPMFGLSYSFHLDKNGRISGVEETSGRQYAYLTKVCFVDDGSEMNDMTMARMFMTDSSTVTTVFAENAKIDGARMKSRETGNGTVSSYHEFFDGEGKFIPQLVRLKFNSLGEISELETANSVTTNKFGYDRTGFTLCYKGNSKYGGPNQRSFNQSYTLASDVIVFNVPPEEDFEESALEIIPASYLQEAQSYSVRLYDADPSWACKAAVIQAVESATWEQALMVVESVEKTIDEDDSVINVIKGYINKQKVTYREKEDGVFPAELESGDIVRVVMSGNKVKRLQILASAKRDTEPFFNNLDGDDWSSYYGQLYAKSNTAVSLTIDGGKSVTALPLNGSATPIYVYDKKTKTARVGSLNDIVMTSPIKEDGTIDLSYCNSMIYVYKRRGYARNIVVIQN